MKIKFSCDEQKNIFLEAMALANKLYSLDFKYVFNKMYDTVNENKIIELYNLVTERKKVIVPKSEFLITKRNQNEIIIDDNDVFTICDKLDLVIRIWIGQWENFNRIKENLTCLNKKDRLNKKLSENPNIFDLRNEIIPLFKNENLGHNASFGINNPKIKNDLKPIYDIYKILMFENGAGGVYGYKPIAISKYKMPIVEIKPVEELYFTSEKQMVKYAINKVKHGSKTVKVEKSDKEVWFYTNEYISKRPNLYQKIYLLKNGYYKF